VERRTADVPLLSGLRFVVCCKLMLQLRHCVPHVVRCPLDVVRSCCADVRVSQDSLNNNVRHSETIQIAAESAPCRVPAVPFGNAVVTFVLVGCLLMLDLRLAAGRAAVERGENHTIRDAA